MATTPKVLLKRSSVAGRVPGAGDLDYGELAINFEDGKIYYKNSSNTISAFVDSARVQAIADAVEVTAQAQLDSAEVIGLVDSAYVQARVPLSYLEGLIDSAYVNARITAHYDGFDSDFGTKTTDDLTEGSSNLYYVKSRVDSDIAASLSDSGNTVSITINNTIKDTVDSAYVLARVAAAPFLDSADAIQLIDSAYIQARQITYDFLDSAEVLDLIDSAYIKSIADSDYIKSVSGINADTLDGNDGTFYRDWNNVTNKPAILDTVDVQNIIDGRVVKSYVDALNVDADTLDGYHATAFFSAIDSAVNALIDGAPGALDTLNELAAALNDDSDAYNTLLGLIAAQLDSAEAIALIDSAHVQARQDYAYSSLTGAPTNVSSFTNDAGYTTYDSANTIGIIDSAYIQARQVDIYRDSAFVTGIIDSAYINARVDSAQIITIINQAGFDSDNAIGLVDSAYVQLRQDYAYSSLTGAPTNVSSFTNDANYIATGDSASLASLTTTGNVTVGGNLQVNGTTVTVNSEDLNVTDNMIYMNAGESSGSPTADIDVGWAANVNDNGSYTHVGMFRDATDDTFKVFGNYTPEPDAAVQINTGHASFELAPFAAKTLTGEYLGFDSDLATKTTTDVTEGTNLYYTKARVDSDIDGRVTKTYVDALNIDADTLDGQTGTFYLNYTNFTNTPNILDSQNVTDLIDSAYINARTSGIDSAAVTSIIDSAYVAARAGAGTDSATVISLIQSTADSAYVQARQLNETAAPLTQSTYNFTATASQTSFTGLSIDSDKFQVYLNGLLLPRADYSHNSTQVDLVVAADSGDVLEVLKFTGNDTGAQAIQQRHYIYTATSGQTVFTGADDNSATLSYTQGRINVYLNGLLLLDSDDYTQNSTGDTVTFTSGVTAGHVVDIQTLSGNTGTFAPLEQTLYEFTADSGQTVFTGSDNNAATLDFSNDKITVYLNGILLSSGDYTPSGGDTITLDVGADSGNLLTVAKLSGNNIGLDSAQVNALISATPSGTDSASVLTLINGYIVQADSDLTTTTADQVIDTFSATTYRTAKYLVQFSHAPSYHSTEVLLVHDGTTVYMTEYAEVKTDSNLGTIDADISGGNVRLKVTPALTNTGVNVTRMNVTV